MPASNRGWATTTGATDDGCMGAVVVAQWVNGLADTTISSFVPCVTRSSIAVIQRLSGLLGLSVHPIAGRKQIGHLSVGRYDDREALKAYRLRGSGPTRAWGLAIGATPGTGVASVCAAGEHFPPLLEKVGSVRADAGMGPAERWSASTT